MGFLIKNDNTVIKGSFINDLPVGIFQVKLPIGQIIEGQFENDTFLYKLQFEYNDTLFSYYSKIWSQDQYTGQAFVSVDKYKIFVSFENGQLDKTQPGIVLDEESNEKIEGKLCLGKKNMKGFIYSEQKKRSIDIDLKNKSIKFN